MSEQTTFKENPSEQIGVPLNPSGHPTVQRYRKNDKIAVLITKGHGAGWSTWHSLSRDVPLEAHLLEVSIFDKDIVEALLEGDGNKAGDICKQRFEALGMGHHFCEYGIRWLGIAWVNEGEEFKVTEYDGLENICLKGDCKWWKA